MSGGAASHPEFAKLTAVQQTLFTHWMSLPRDAHPIVPQKKSLKPANLAKIAANLGMAEHFGRYNLLIRMLGTTVDDMIGEVKAGINAFDMYGPDIREFFADLFEVTQAQPCAYYGWSQMHVSRGRVQVMRDLHLPLCDERGTVRYLISCFEHEGASLAGEHASPVIFTAATLLNYTALDIGAGKAVLPRHPGLITKL